MEEGTIFQPQPPASAPPPQPPASSPPPSSTPPPPPQPPAPPPGIDESEGFFSNLNFRKIAKIGLVVFGIFMVLLLFLVVILPRFNKPSDENVELTYWGLWEDPNIMQAVISEFESQNPRIKINYEKQDVKEYRERLMVRSENGTGPDIFKFHNTWYPQLSSLLLPLPKDVISREQFEENYFEVAKEDLIKNGAIYGVPLGTDSLSLYINKRIFDEAGAKPPTTWQEFIDVSEALTKRGEDGRIEVAGAGIGTYENISHAPDIISLLFAQNGVDFDRFEESKGRIIDALTFYTNFALVENNVWDDTLDNSLVAFSSERSAMFFGYSWDYFTIKALNPNLNLSVEKVPQLLKSEPVNLASYWAEGVSSKSRHQKEALVFMKYLSTLEVQEKLFTEASKTRPFGEPYSSPALKSKLEGSPAFVFSEQSETAKSSPFVDSTFDNGLNDKLNNYLKDAVNGILTNTSPETAVETLFQGYQQVLGQYGE